jgi:hypothetical protein
MLKLTVSFALSAALLFTTAARPAHARPQGEEEARRVGKLKERAEKFYKGRARRVEVKLKDGRKLKGRVVGIGETDFLLADTKAGTASTIRYDEVKDLKIPIDHKRGLIMTGVMVGIFTWIILGLRSVDQ